MKKTIIYLPLFILISITGVNSQQKGKQIMSKQSLEVATLGGGDWSVTDCRLCPFYSRTLNEDHTTHHGSSTRHEPVVVFLESRRRRSVLREGSRRGFPRDT